MPRRFVLLIAAFWVIALPALAIAGEAWSTLNGFVSTTLK